MLREGSARFQRYLELTQGGVLANVFQIVGPKHRQFEQQAGTARVCHNKVIRNKLPVCGFDVYGFSRGIVS